MNLEARLRELLELKFQEEEFQDLFVVEMKLSENKVFIYLDSDTKLSLEHCRRISRHLEHHIEENAWLPEAYLLEVSSPGLDRPLRLKRQYQKNKGRTISIALISDHRNVKGTLSEVHEDYVVVEYEEKQRIEGKKKKKLVVVRQEVPFEDIEKAVIKPSFK